jgi:hypothetical protein
VFDETSVGTQMAFISQGDRTERVSKSRLQRINKDTMRASETFTGKRLLMRKESCNPVSRLCSLLAGQRVLSVSGSGPASDYPIKEYGVTKRCTGLVGHGSVSACQMGFEALIYADLNALIFKLRDGSKGNADLFRLVEAIQ